MINRTLIPLLTATLALTVSCASASAKQPATMEPIENLAKPGSLAPALSDGLESAMVSGGEGNAQADQIGVNEKVRGGSAKRHPAGVTALAQIPETPNFYSGDAFGFITRHDETNAETWQVSDLPVRRIAVHPDGKLVAIYEADGFTVHRVSVWNWPEKRRVFAKRFKDTVLSLSWSAKGTWLFVGNSSLEGVTSLNGLTGEALSLFGAQPGMVSFAVTGKTETSVMTFGPSGKIIYTDLANGATRAAYQGPADIASPRPLNNNRYIAGVADGSVNVIDATNGKTVTSWKSDAAPSLVAAGETDTEPSWLETRPDAEWAIRRGAQATPDFAFPGSSVPLTTLVIGSRFIIGASDGVIYGTDLSFPASEPPRLTAIDSMPTRRIDDAASDGERLFILTGGTLLVSAGPGKAPLFAFDGIAGNRVSLVDGALLFWSDREAVPVTRSSLDGETRETIYSPSEPVTAMNPASGTIALIEGFSKVAVLAMGTGGGPAQPFTYRGIGLQDILAFSASSVIVTKSATARSPSPVIKIDPRTGETVPYTIPGNLCYGIRALDSLEGGFTGFLVDNDANGPVTKLVTVTALDQSGTEPSVSLEATYADEDVSAVAVSHGNRVYTNLGKGPIVEIDRDRASARRFPRGYSLPKRIVLMESWAVTINRDGSVSWLNRDSGTLDATSSITMDGFWIEE